MKAAAIWTLASLFCLAELTLAVIGVVALSRYGWPL